MFRVPRTKAKARFYETGVDEFGFLTNLYKVFDGD
jgi:hypothetical protein